ncbi:MAG: ABC transporter substrate-binding protein [Provencibacterium sp.]|nr:ABC transporter substrate-binding protein [Provencibacterium sp.]
MKWKKRLGALWLAGLLCACGSQPPRPVPPPDLPSSSSSQSEPDAREPGFPVTVGGATLEKKPERVVSLNPSITEILCDLGLGPALAGVGDWDNPPALPEGASRCGTEIAPDIPAIRQAGAEAVLVLGPLPERARLQLEEADIPLIRLEKPETVEALPGYYEEIAKALLGEEEGPAAAAAFSEPLMAQWSALVQAASELPSHPLGAFMAYLPLTLATADSLQGRLLEQCGITNAGADYAGWQYPEELLLPFNPEVLVVDIRTVTPEEAAAHPNYKTTPCVLNGRVLGVDGSALENGGARLFETAGQIARLAGAELPPGGAETAGEGTENAPEA